jgi:AraC-like DNA-binding protein
VRQRGARAQLEPYREYVESRLRDVDFRLADVSREFRVSDRYVRLVFKCGNENLSEYVLRRRLELAAQMLRNAEHARQTILAIAVDCGFSSATHFSHSFRQRYGMTPSAFRRDGLPAAE